MSTEPSITTAVVTGGHPFDVIGLQEAFRALPGVHAYFQHMEDFATDAGGNRKRYDVVVFYHMLQELPPDEAPWAQRKIRQALENIPESDQGILVLHHSILGYPEWKTWNDLVGIPDPDFQSYHHGESVASHVIHHDHPVTTGLADWTMTDETYVMPPAREEDGNTILLTTDHPRSMETLAWTRQCGRAPVLCWQAGHDNQTFADPHFRAFLLRALRWLSQAKSGE